MLCGISLLDFSPIFKTTDELWNITSAFYLYSAPVRTEVTRITGTSPSFGCYGQCRTSTIFAQMSSYQTIKEVLQKIKPELVRKYHVKSLGLFGSVVRDDFSPAKSDVDIIVEFSQPIGIEFVDLADYLEFQIKRKVDLVSRNGIKKNFYKEIEREIVYV